MEHQRPLADRMRPKNFDEFFGQADIVGEGKILRKLIDQDELPSLIFWGPPGVGKTTIAHIIAEQTHSHFATMSAVESGKSDLLKIVEAARERIATTRKGLVLDESHVPRTILFVDEIHRWNKAQQDALLPYVEKGIITLIGATTENPSFEIIGALLSRSRVFVLKKLEAKDLLNIINRALKDEERGLGKASVKIGQEEKEFLAEVVGGDARVALNALEIAVKAHGANHPARLPASGVVGEAPLLRKEGTGNRRRSKERTTLSPPLEGGVADSAKAGEAGVVVTKDDLKEALQKIHLIFDKQGEEFYNIISALHKSMRGSDANAALYWLARMLEGGADPLYIARRVVRFASEDIGMANSEALVQALAAYQACHYIGMPECTVHLAQAVVYCAKSKKSNLLYTAYGKAAKDAEQTSHLGVPLHIRNAPTKLMNELNYGKGYKYPPLYQSNDLRSASAQGHPQTRRAGNPDYDGPVEQDYLPPELEGRDYFKSDI